MVREEQAQRCQLLTQCVDASHIFHNAWYATNGGCALRWPQWTAAPPRRRTSWAAGWRAACHPRPCIPGEKFDVSGMAKGLPGFGGRLTDDPVRLTRQVRAAVRARSLDLTGQVFGRLEVLRFAGHSRKASGETRRMWECRCGCSGRKLLVRAEDLRSGNTRSCGCLKRRAGAAAVRERRIDEYAARLNPEFWRAFSELLAGRALDLAVLRLRWPGLRPAFGEIFERRRRVPSAEEAGWICEMLVLRGFDRDGFERLCFEARLARERAVERWGREHESRI